MPTTLGEFHSLVKDEVKRGDSLDSIIPLRVKLAVQFLERNYSMEYMRSFMEATLDPNVSSPKVITLPAATKSVRFLRAVGTTNYHYLKHGGSKDQQVVYDEGLPEHFWKLGLSQVILDRKPDKAYKLEGELILYTDWPTATNSTPWLLQHGLDLLLAQTMLHMGNFLRDDQIIKQYRGSRDEALRTMMLAEQETSYDGMDSEMAYSPKYGFASEFIAES